MENGRKQIRVTSTVRVASVAAGVESSPNHSLAF